jgi:hypothetical protein
MATASPSESAAPLHDPHIAAFLEVINFAGARGFDEPHPYN